MADQIPPPSSPRPAVPPTGPGPRPRWPLVAGAAVLALVAGGVGALLVAAFDSDTTVAAGSSRSSSQAVCTASQVATEVLPSIVTISASSGRSGGTGTGEIIQPGGYILTNNHVIAAAAHGGTVEVLYSDGRTSPATIVGRDPTTDVAVIKAEDGASGLPVIATTSSRALQVGQPVVALGAPLGLSSTVTSGIVSALDRYLQVPGDEGQPAHLVGAIQTDASINPGNSGGALVDCRGRMVGMHSAIATVPNAQGVAGGGSVGLGFAIPTDLALPLAKQIIATARWSTRIPGGRSRRSPRPSRPRPGCRRDCMSRESPRAARPRGPGSRPVTSSPRSTGSPRSAPSRSPWRPSARSPATP